jgi:small GTP-binding protein
MIHKKVCMVGAFAAGKTSLVSRYVHSRFSDRYLTTLGVKIDKKVLNVGKAKVNLLLWDIHGEDDFQKVRGSYLRGASGCLLVADGTRAPTVEVAASLSERVRKEVGDIPTLLTINKSDLREQWDIDDSSMQIAHGLGHPVIETSARTGEAVEEAFIELVKRMLS